MKHTIAALSVLFVLLPAAVRAQTQDFFSGNASQPSPSGFNSLACRGSGCIGGGTPSALTVASIGTCTAASGTTAGSCAITMQNATDESPGWTTNQFAPQYIGSTCSGFSGAIGGDCTTTTAAAAVGATTFTVASATNILPRHWIRFFGGTNSEWWTKVASVSGSTVTTEAAAPFAFGSGTTIDGPPGQEYYLAPNIARPTRSVNAINNQRFPGCVTWPITGNTANTITVSVPVLANGKSYPVPNQADSGSIDITQAGDSFAIYGDWLVEDYTNSGLPGKQRMITDPLGNGSYQYTLSDFTVAGDNGSSGGAPWAPSGTGYNGRYGDIASAYYIIATALRDKFGITTLGYDVTQTTQMNPQSSFSALPSFPCDGPTAMPAEVALNSDLGFATQKMTIDPGGSYATNGVFDQPSADWDDSYNTYSSTTYPAYYGGGPDPWDVRFESSIAMFIDQFYDNTSYGPAWGSVGYSVLAPYFPWVEYSESDGFQPWADAQGFKTGLSDNGSGADHFGEMALVNGPYAPDRIMISLSALTPRQRATDPIQYYKLALVDYLRWYYRPGGDTIPTFSYDFRYPCQTMGSVSCTTDVSRGQYAGLPWGESLEDAGQYLYHATPTGNELTALQNLNAAWGSNYTSWMKLGGTDILESAVKTGTATSGANSTSGSCTVNSKSITYAGQIVASSGIFTTLDQGSTIEMTGGSSDGEINEILCIGTTNVANDTAYVRTAWTKTVTSGAGVIPASGDTFRYSGHYNQLTSCSGSTLTDSTNSPFTSAMVGQQVMIFDALAENTNKDVAYEGRITGYTNASTVTVTPACPSSTVMGEAIDPRYASPGWAPYGTPLGTGFLDENGQNSWEPQFSVYQSYYGLQWMPKSSAETQAQRDAMVTALNNYEQVTVSKMFEALDRVTKDQWPNLLIEGQELFGADRPSLVKGTAGLLDLFPASPIVSCAAVGDFTSAGCVLSSHPSADSSFPFSANAGPGDSWTRLQFWEHYDSPNQTRRGTITQLAMEDGFSEESSNGVFPVVGWNYFGTLDWPISAGSTNGGNWGFATNSTCTGCAFDNFYDGVDDIDDCPAGVTCGTDNTFSRKLDNFCTTTGDCNDLASWHASETIRPLTMIVDSNGGVEQAGAAGGTTGSSTPSWAAGGSAGLNSTVSDGSVVWTKISPSLNHDIDIPCATADRGGTSLAACTDTFVDGGELQNYGDYSLGMEQATDGLPGNFGGMYHFMNGGAMTTSVSISLPVSSGTVKYGLCSHDSAPWTIGSPSQENLTNSVAISSSSVTLTRLAPESAYDYQIYNSSGAAISPVMSFYTRTNINYF